MRSLRLIGAIAQAEGLRLKAEARAFARSVAVFAAAALFGLIALGLLHAAAWMWLADRHGPMGATLALASVDALLMVAIAVALRPRPSTIAKEALALRQQSVAALRSVSPLREALGLIAWRNPVHMAGGRVAEHVWRRFTQPDRDRKPLPAPRGRRR